MESRAVFLAGVLESNRIVDMMFSDTKPYRHYKGRLYCTLSAPVAMTGSAEDRYVVYQALYGDHDIWCRREAEFSRDVGRWHHEAIYNRGE